MKTYIRTSKMEDLRKLAQPEQDEKFCDANCVWTDHHPDCKLAQPEEQRSCDKQEPVAWLDEGLGAFYWAKDYKKDVGFTPLYTTPPQRKSLTDEIPKGVLLAISNAGLTLLKTQHGYELRKLGLIEADLGIKEEA